MSKPKCHLTGEDGNAFAVMGRVKKALKGAGQSHLIPEFLERAMGGDYNHLLAVCMEYVEDIGSDDGHDPEAA